MIKQVLFVCSGNVCRSAMASTYFNSFSEETGCIAKSAGIEAMAGDEMTVGRIDYRYEFKKDIFIKLMGNAAFGYKINGQSPPAGNNIILGYAIGLQFQSIIGPFEFIYSRGDHSPLHPGPKQYNYYFKAGFIF